jgi:hypothetical protein
MSRSIHTTKKDLKRERYFSHTDDVSRTGYATELERADINKSLRKLNEGRKRQAKKQNAPAHAHLKLEKNELVRSVRKREAVPSSKKTPK